LSVMPSVSRSMCLSPPPKRQVFCPYQTT